MTDPIHETVALSKEFEDRSPTILGAYHICLRAEELVQGQLTTTTSTSQRAGLEKGLINIRILGHLLSVGPTDEGRRTVAQAIISCNREPNPEGELSKLIALGDFYDKHFIRLFRKYKGRTPTPSPHISRPSFDTKQALIEALLIETPQNHSEAKKNALCRDNFRCMLTGTVDETMAETIPELIASADADGQLVGLTQCCHIIPASINTDLHDPQKKVYSSAVWTILESFGYRGITDALAGRNIHSLTNIMTLDATAHNYFDTLRLWFEPTNTPNHYTVHLHKTRLFAVTRIPRSVTFTSTSPTLALPSANYLKIHAACCRVAHMSGAAEYLERMERDTDDYNGFAPIVADEFAGKLAARLYDLSFSSSPPYVLAS